jgi:7,8-dihydropterin-6-yl-methyl-4-(beta-D-ribofuranosyl)aminobenzene 5'-phosphate synthase
MRVTTLIENDRVEGREDLTAEFGLSLHIQRGDLQILFDTGASGAFADNAGRLGIDLKQVSVAVLSHHHFDHGGGLRRFLAGNERARVHLRASGWAPRYFRTLVVVKRPIGLDPSLFDRYAHRFEFVTESLEIAPGVFLLTDIGAQHPRPQGNRHLFVERNGELEPDPFEHELVLVVLEDDGMVVFTGCSHHGILNMMEAARSRFPGLSIKAVFGGFHLIGVPFFDSMAAPREEVEAIGRKILDLTEGPVFTGHCTGRKAYGVLAGVMGSSLRPFSTGTSVEV